MSARTPIAVGDTFTAKVNGNVNTYRREADDESPAFECERIRVTHLTCSTAVNWQPYTFGIEPEWFAVRGLVVAS